MCLVKALMAAEGVDYSSKATSGDADLRATVLVEADHTSPACQ